MRDPNPLFADDVAHGHDDGGVESRAAASTPFAPATVMHDDAQEDTQGRGAGLRVADVCASLSPAAPVVVHEDDAQGRGAVLRFADVCASLPPAAPLADTLAGPAWAAAWADAIVCFWETEQALGSLDADQPLYLLDIAPGRGVLAWLLIQALDARLPSSRAAGRDWRYLVCDDGHEATEDGEAPATLRRLRAHPRFAPLLETGRVDTACWPLPAGGTLRLDGGQAAIERTVNPVVAIAAGWFSRQPAGLYAAHYGQWMEAEVEVSRSADAYALSYRWQPASPDDLAPAWAPLAARYVEQLVSACVSLPTGAMALVDALRSVSGERYLLLACDAGASCEADLRDGALEAPGTWLPGDAMAPVNFHALGWRQRSAWSVERQTGARGLTVQAVWSRAGGEPPAAARLTLTGVIERCEPCDARQLAQTAGSIAEHAPLDTLATLLRTSAYDPVVLAAVLPHWPARSTQLSGAPGGTVPAWRGALARTWRHHLPDARTAQFDSQLGSAAAALGDWQLAKEIWCSVLAFDENGRVGTTKVVGEAGRLNDVDGASDAKTRGGAREGQEAYEAQEAHEAQATHEAQEAHEPDDLHHARWRACVHLHLAHCLASSGELTAACTQVALAYQLDPDDPDVHAWRVELAARAAHQRALPWYFPELARDAGLAIEPLGAEHAEALHAAYADPHIASLANLPPLSELQDVHAWLDDDAAEAGRTSYAVMDSQRGFVGVVSLCRAGDAAYFYFWIDAHAQRLGFGTRAARLLFAQARAAGIVDIFTASYAANARSHGALRQLGFSSLPVRSAGDPQVGFFHFRTIPATGTATHAGSEDTIAHFATLCDAIDAPVVLVAQAAGPSTAGNAR
ncbi:GNAT family protein [Paraburkholderia sediminicola]|uniref:GNAT family N-acetyltransferase n=1 Tax=Paraburkholderia TaxID=1822464 RepID=UPI0038BB9C7F